MISKHDLERILRREANGKTVLSLFLDMSVDSNNKRTHKVFLNQRRAQFEELESERPSQPREAIGRAFQQIEEWLAEEYDEENRGVALYAELAGEWFEALQFPVSIQNRLVLSDRPLIAPLAQVLEGYRHLGVVLLDREQARFLSIYLGSVLEEVEISTNPYPAVHGVQAGGLSQRRFQRRKKNETHQFFRDFAEDLERFVRQEEPEELVVLGTEDIVALFRNFLPKAIDEKIVLTAPMLWVEEGANEILERIEPHLRAEREREDREFLEDLKERVEQDYLATAGFQTTIDALRQGRVERLAIAQDQERTGSRCPRCDFIFADGRTTCPYDGSETIAGIDLYEEAVRLAERQELEVEFMTPAAMQELAGVAALLRY